MDTQKIIGYGARAAGAYAALRYGPRLLPVLGKLPAPALLVVGWLAAGLVLDAAIPGKGD